MNDRVLYLEPLGGIAGDMFLAAAIDAGVDARALEEALRTLGLPHWHLHLEKSARHMVTGTHLDVHVHAHGHTHGHEHEHGHEHAHDTDSGHHPAGNRSLSDIKEIIQSSGLPARAKERALAVFSRLGAVEAKIHGVKVEEIHFHEVGATDSIVDICGAAMVLELLGDPKVFSSPPPLGSGKVRIAHGVVPVPVPATLELLKGKPVLHEGVGELTTPTGAALLAEFATIGPPPPMVVEHVGYGLGTKDFKDRANVLRMTLGRATQKAATLTVLEANLDDCSPQLLGALLEALLEKGARDAWVAPVTMKKGRPGHLVGALVDGPTRAAVEDTLLRESTTLGVRSYAVERTELDRRFEEVTTPYGAVRVKIGSREGTVLNAAPEFEDCRARAQAANVPVKQVLQAALAAWWAKQKP
jgi:pyridinium-3,5-bisthiocarboxylic acid mononucleotide nickel chelatase